MITTVGPVWSVPSLRKLPLFAVLVLTWMLATNHCEIHAIGGVVETTQAAIDLQCCPDNPIEVRSLCDTNESDSYRGASGNAKAGPPVLATLGYEHQAAHRPTLSKCLDSRFVESESEPSANWIPKWQFDRRAAAPAHAPDSVIF